MSEETFTIEERVIKLLENIVFQGYEIKDNSTWEQMGLDSLDKIEMLMDMEDEFKVDISDDAMAYMETVDDLVGFLERILQK
jgi:acyl carrier protein